jgi:acetylcholinesterase
MFGRFVCCIRFPPLLVLFFTHTSVNSHTVSKRLKAVPKFGAYHSSDLQNIYAGGDLADFLIQFVTNMDPNGILSPQWPRYTTSSPQLMTLLGNQLEVTNNNRTITLDTFRVEGTEFLTDLSLMYSM